MNVEIDKILYEVIFQKKKIKRTYLRITNDKKLLVTSNLNLKEKDIIKLIETNLNWVKKQLQKFSIITIEENEFLLFGNKYRIIINNNFNIEDNNIYSPSQDKIYEWGFNEIKQMFNNTLRDFDLKFTPFLVFRKMKSRWGVCHIKKEKVVLNKALIHVPQRLIKYVIYHELTHFYHPNHSRNFYQALQKTCPKHKLFKQELKKYISLL